MKDLICRKISVMILEHANSLDYNGMKCHYFADTDSGYPAAVMKTGDPESKGKRTKKIYLRIC